MPCQNCLFCISANDLRKHRPPRANLSTMQPSKPILELINQPRPYRTDQNFLRSSCEKVNEHEVKVINIDIEDASNKNLFAQKGERETVSCPTLTLCYPFKQPKYGNDRRREPKNDKHSRELSKFNLEGVSAHLFQPGSCLYVFVFCRLREAIGIQKTQKTYTELKFERG